MGITLQGMTTNGYLAPELAGEIFKKATTSSIVGSLAGSTTMGISGSEYIIQGADPEAAIVGEGGKKPTDDIAFATKTVRPVKAALIVTWSKEARLKNPAGILDNLQERMAEAIRRQVDSAILYGKSRLDGAAIAGVQFLNQTTNRVELGSGLALAGSIIDGYDAVVGANYDFTGFAADPRLKTSLMRAEDAKNSPIYQGDVNLGATTGSILGLPVTFGKTVSQNPTGGKVFADSGVRAFGGDFAGNLKLGFAEQINFKMTDQATVNGVSLWETNQEAALVEAIFGWVINDPAAFVAYEGAAKPPIGG